MKLRPALVCAVIAVGVYTSNSDAQSPLRYQFNDGEKLRYVMDLKIKTITNVMEMNFETTTDLALYLSLNVIGFYKDGSARMQFKANRARMETDGPIGKIKVDSNDKHEADDEASRLLGQIIKVLGTLEMNEQMLATGETKKASVSDATIKAIQNIRGADRVGSFTDIESIKAALFGVVFPEEAIAKGLTWTTKSESKTALGHAINECVFTSDGTVERSGATLHKISWKTNIKTDAKPNAENRIKDVQSRGYVLFDNKLGRLVESTISQTTEMQLNANGIDFNQRVEQEMTLHLTN